MSSLIKSVSSYLHVDFLKTLLYTLISSFAPDNYYVARSTASTLILIEGMWDHVVPHCSVTMIFATF